MDGYSIAGLQPGKISEQGRHFIHPHIKLPIGDDLVSLILRFRHINESRFIGVPG
jgi:hypothetical protein